MAVLRENAPTATRQGFKQKYDMIKAPMYPLHFEPIYQYRLWGGRRLADLLAAPLPGDGPIGEAWLLSDRDEHSSKVAAGPLKGSTIRQLMEQSPNQLLGKLAGRFRRFPVLLKFLDAHDNLSVQVHPEDWQTDYIPNGDSGKTEAWVVLKAEPASRIYAGLKPGTTKDDLKRALASRAVPNVLAGFAPRNARGPSPTLCSPPASTGATTSARRTGSTFITGWPTTGSAWRVSTYRNLCRQGHPPIRPEPRAYFKLTVNLR